LDNLNEKKGSCVSCSSSVSTGNYLKCDRKIPVFFFLAHPGKKRGELCFLRVVYTVAVADGLWMRLVVVPMVRAEPACATGRAAE
jgi:hypothetical protein